MSCCDAADALGAADEPRPHARLESERAALWLLTAFGGFILLYNVGLAVALPLSIVETATGQGNATFRALLAVLAGWTFFILVRWIVVQALALRELHVRHKAVRPVSSWPGVSIIVPAYREAENIEPALESLARLDYPVYEVIVVDDGSPDDTYARARNFAAADGSGRFTVLTKLNAGKWSALNRGIAHALFELVLCIDADSRLSPSALRRLIPHLAEPAVAGVSGQVIVRNQVNLITRLQHLEYVMSNGGLRTAQSLLGSVLVVPGPIGLYRRAVLDEIVARSAGATDIEREGAVAGPLSDETFAEDFQLSLTVLALGYRIVYEPAAIALTRAPASVQQLINQRYRWMRGNMQVLHIYAARLRGLCAPSVRRRLGLLVGLFYAIDAVLIPLLSAAILLVFLINLASGNATAALSMWIASLWISNLMSAAYFLVSQKDNPSLAAMSPLMELYQGLVINSAWLIAAFDQARKARMNW